MAKKTTKEKRKKEIKEIKKGRIYIQSTFNNTIITLTDASGNVLFGKSAGSLGFKGTRKSTPYAASQTALRIAEEAKSLGLEEAEVYLKGIGSGRASAVKSLSSGGINITKIADRTPVPHNGPRPKKPRRV